MIIVRGAGRAFCGGDNFGSGLGAYLSGMWLYRLGMTKAKDHALTGKPLSGREAADGGLINECRPL